MLWDITISKSLNRYLQRVKVNGARKSLFTLSVTLAFTLANEQMPCQERVAHDRKVKLAAEWHRVGLERPHFCTRFHAQSESWVAPAQQETSFGTRGENLGEAGEEGRNYLLQLRLHHLLQLVMRISLGKTRK
jgi:hypothetical protein